MKRKLLALALSLSMVAGLAACGSEPAESSKESSAPQKESSAEASKEEVKEEVKEDPAELRLIMYGDMTERREDFFANEFHEKVLEDLNIDMTVEFLPWGALTGDVTNRLMAGEKFMFMFGTSGTDHAQRGLVAEISQEDIDTYLPHHKEARGNNGFEFSVVNDKVVVIPVGNKAYAANNKTLTVRNDVLKKVGWDYTMITDYDSLVEACTAVHEAFPEMRILTKPGHLNLAMDAVVSDHVTSGMGGTTMVYLDDADDKVYSYWESDEFKNWMKIVEEWRDLGFILDDHVSDPSAGPKDWSAGNALIYSGVPGNMVEPGVKASMGEGADLQLVMIGDVEEYPRYTTTNYDWGLGISVAAQDDVPDYLRFIDWIYESQENYEFCIYGVEGTDWERNADGTIKKLGSDMMFDDWFLQAFCYHTYDATISEETIKIYESWDDGAQISKVAGFVFDSTPVAAEKALIDAVYSEYLYPMYQGFLDFEENYDSVIKKLKEAGLDAYMEEYQKQYSAWYAENKK